MNAAHRYAWFLLALPLLAACGSTDPYKLPYDKLELAMVHLDTGHHQDAVLELEELLARTQEQAEAFSLQRFYANYLLARAHVRSTRDGKAFIMEEVPVDPSLAGLVDASGRRPSVNAHLMASLLHAHEASELLAEQIDAAREVALEDGSMRPLLPERLMDFAVADAGRYLSLARLAALGRLGFEDDVRVIVSRVPDLASVAGAEQLLARARVDEDAWADLFVFQFRAYLTTDRELAFKFAVRALDQAARNDGTYNLDEPVFNEIKAFMESGFRCTACDRPVVGGEIYCPRDSSHYGETAKDDSANLNANGG